MKRSSSSKTNSQVLSTREVMMTRSRICLLRSVDCRKSEKYMSFCEKLKSISTSKCRKNRSMQIICTRRSKTLLKRSSLKETCARSTGVCNNAIALTWLDSTSAKMAATRLENSKRSTRLRWKRTRSATLLTWATSTREKCKLEKKRRRKLSSRESPMAPSLISQKTRQRNSRSLETSSTSTSQCCQR